MREYVDGAQTSRFHSPHRRGSGAIEADVEILIDGQRVALEHVAILDPTAHRRLAESAARRMGTTAIQLNADTLEASLKAAAEQEWDALAEEQQLDEVTVDLAHGTEPGPRESRVEDFAPEGFTTMIYGGPGTLKTYLAVLLAICMRTGLSFLGRAVKACRVLVLDWELDETEYRRRAWHLSRPLGLESPPGINYRRMRRPLLTALPEIRAEIVRLGVEVIIIDSFSIAGCSEKDTAIAGIQALDSLGITPIIFDHQARTLATESYGSKLPYGTTFKEIGVRAAWQVELADIHPSRWAIDMLIRNQKETFTSKQDEIAIRVHFLSDSVRMETIKAADSVGLAAKLPKGQQVLLALRALSPTTAKEIEKEVGFSVGYHLSMLKRQGLTRSEPTSSRKSDPHTWYAVVPELSEIVEKEEETAPAELPAPSSNGSKPDPLDEWPRCVTCGVMMPICYSEGAACPNCQHKNGASPMDELTDRLIHDLHTCWDCSADIPCGCLKPDGPHRCADCAALLDEVSA